MKLSLLALSSSAAILSLVACVSESSPEGNAAPEANSADGGAAPDATDATPPPASSDGGAAPLCASLAATPVAAQLVGALFQGSEDFTFDGQGRIVGKRGNALVALAASGVAAPTTIAELPGQTYGLRYLPNGLLVAAIPGAGKVVTITRAGQVTDLVTGLASPNGILTDEGGNVWITEFGGSKVLRVAPDGTRTTIVSGANAQAANGLVLDAARKILFYTEYQKGKINRISLATPGATAVNVATIPGAALDGMVLDACGNVYAVDQCRSRLFRVRTDATGAASDAPELVATFPTNVANAQFGAGPGFDSTKLYVTGNPGSVYTLDLGVGGAPVPTPSFD